MKVRFGTVLAMAVALIAGACASGGGGGGGGEEGIEPRTNQYTNSATLFMQQAQQAESDSLAQERYEQALESAEEGIEADSMNPQSYYQAGFALVMLDRDYDRADSLLSTAVDLYPGYREQIAPVRERAWINLYNQALQPLNSGDIQGAIELFEQANQLYGDRPEAYLNLGTAYAQMGETEEAAQAFRDALEVIRQQSEAVAQADSVRPEERENIQRNNRIAVQNLGRTLNQLGRNQEAVAVYTEYLENHPDDIEVLSSLAVALSRAEMPDSARAINENLLDREGLTAQQYITVGVGLYQAEQFERAAEAFERALEQNSRSRDAAYNLAQAYFSSEDWDLAVESARRVLELDPRNGNLYKLLARSLAEAGDQQTAGDVLEEYQALSFETQGLQFQPSPDGGATVTGVLSNRTVPQGEPIILEFHFAADDGSQLGTQQQTIPAPGVNETRRFEVIFNSDETPTAYHYEVVRP